MSYLGENRHFSFRDGCCESLSGTVSNSSDAAEFGRTIAGHFKRFAAGCENFNHTHILYAISSGIAECGKDVFMYENTELPSFKFGYPLLSADCGIYISGNGSIRISLFDESRFPLCDRTLTAIMDDSAGEPAEKFGKISSVSSFRNLYVNNIADALELHGERIGAGISCGNPNVRSLWQNFFTGEDDNLVFQISDDGERVNAYSTEAGFISHEKLALAYAVKIAQSGRTAFLPDDFHYAADYLNNDSNKLIERFSAENKIPQEVIEQRFLFDPLFMCAHLAKNKKLFLHLIKELPQLASAKREVAFSFTDTDILTDRQITENGGRIKLTRSGKNRVTLTAQSFSSETAAELCAVWSEKLRRINKCREITE